MALVLVTLAVARVRSHAAPRRVSPEADLPAPPAGVVRPASTGLASIDGRVPTAPSRLVVSGSRRAPAAEPRRAALERPGVPRVQLLRDASTVMLGFVGMILIATTLFAGGRDGEVAGVTDDPGEAAATQMLVAEESVGPGSSEPVTSNPPLPGEVVPSLAPAPSPATPAPAASPTPTPTSVRAATPGPAATPTPTRRPTTNPTPTPRPRPTPTKPPPTPTPKATPTPEPTPTPTPTPTPEPTPTPTPTPTPDPTPTPTPDPTPTPTPTPTPDPAEGRGRIDPGRRTA